MRRRDSALLRVVPADQILRTNLGYNALRAVIALSGLTWPVDAVLVLAVLVLLRRKRGVVHYGWDRLSPLAHWLCGLPLVVSGAASALFVTTVNAWMNTPAGFRLAHG